MKHFKTYESFKKTYGQKITQSKFKDIPIGKRVMYLGSLYTVIANDGYVLDLNGENGDQITVNLGQFNRSGQINEKKSSVWKIAYAGKGFYGVYDAANDGDIEGEWPSKKAAQAEADKRNSTNESLNEAARVPSNIMDFAKRKGSYAVSLVKKAATWAEKAGKYISGGTAIGKNYDTIILDMKHQGSEIYINLNDETIELFGEEVTDAKSFKRVLDANK